MVCKRSHVVVELFIKVSHENGQEVWTAILVPIASAVCLYVVFAVEFELVFS